MSKKRIITHNGSFHVDEVFAVAVLDMVYDSNVEIIRTRDEDSFERADYLVDVGRRYDPVNNLFDHHQPEGAGERANGIPYASFGLIWKHFGDELTGSKEVAEKIDEKMVQPIDAIDNGILISEPNAEYGVREFSFGSFIDLLNPSWNEERESDKRFSQAVRYAKVAIERVIVRVSGRIEARPLVKKFYEEADDKRIILMDGIYSWKETIINYPEPLYMVFPETSNKKWITYAVPKELGKFERRKAFPEDWAGKENLELAEATGVPDAVFCHRGLFLCVSESKEGAIKLAKIAADS